MNRIEMRLDVYRGAVLDWKFGRYGEVHELIESDVDAWAEDWLRRKGKATWDAGEASARIELGRWLMDCTCNSGIAVTPGIPRATCIECGARWLVRMPLPSLRQRIEATLLARPQENRNWRPEETAAALEAETLAHAVAACRACPYRAALEAAGAEGVLPDIGG